MYWKTLWVSYEPWFKIVFYAKLLFKTFRCPVIKPQWLGRKHNTLRYQSSNSAIIRTNVYNTNPAVNAIDGSYIGFLMFSKRQCSNNFLRAVDSGLINFDIMDKSKFYRQEFTYSERKESVVIQFRKLQSGEDEIKNKKDQMILGINGLGEICYNFHKKSHLIFIKRSCWFWVWRRTV